jgi:hypothetical protein
MRQNLPEDTPFPYPAPRFENQRYLEEMLRQNNIDLGEKE